MRVALDSVDGAARVSAALEGSAGDSLRMAGRPVPADRPVVLLAVGKAADAMTRGALGSLPRPPRAGLVVARDPGPTPPAPLVRTVAGHPVPDARSAAAGRAARDLVASTGPEDVLLVLLSGGASALMTSPLPGLSSADLATTTDALLRAGADIEALNAVRRQLTLASGGRLARASGTREIHVLALSDVPGDDPAVLGSGPFARPRGSAAQALAALAALGDAGVPEAVRAHIEREAEAERAGEGGTAQAAAAAIFDDVAMTVLASNADARDAAVGAARRAGFEAHAEPEELAGEAAGEGRRLAGQAVVAAPRTLRVHGGETTVRVRGAGLGGRCQELALAAAIRFAGEDDVAILAAGTDGSDGPTDAAGAFADGGTVARGRAAGVSARACLADNDAYGFFDREGGLVRTGPTGSNVRDLVLVARGGSEAADG